MLKLRGFVTKWAMKQVIAKGKLYKATQYKKNKSEKAYVVVIPNDAARWLVAQGDIALNNALMCFMVKKLNSMTVKEAGAFAKGRLRIIPVMQEMLEEDGGLVNNTKNDRIFLGEEV